MIQLSVSFTNHDSSVLPSPALQNPREKRYAKADELKAPTECHLDDIDSFMVGRGGHCAVSGNELFGRRFCSYDALL